MIGFIDQRPHLPNPPRAALGLPSTLTPTWRELPRSAWVLARAFSPRRGQHRLGQAREPGRIYLHGASNRKVP